MIQILNAIARHLSFPGDSLVLLTLLLATNCLRIYLPGPIADGIFGVTVLLLALSLFRERLSAAARTSVLCFLALLAVYGLGLIIDFSIQGASNFIGILFAGIIFLFFWHNAATLIRARYTIPLLLTAGLALFPLYLLLTEFNPHAFSILLSYLLLSAGLIVIVRSDNRKSQHRWAHGLFLLVAAIGIVFGYRSLVLSALLAFPLYWSGYFFLRNRLRVSGLAAVVGVLIGMPIVLLGTSRFDALLAPLDSFGREFTGSGVQTGREVLWRYSLAAISESFWLGRGPGAVITRPRPDRPADKARDSPPPAQSSDREPSCMDSSNPGLLGDCGVLLEARNALDGGSAAINSWKPSNLLHSWRGVKLEGDPPRVVAVNLREVNLRGVVPPEMGRLERLEVLRLSSNALTGPIPPELGQLANLRVLALDDNALSGPVPPELGQLEHLEGLWLRGNRLSGEVPQQLGTLGNLSLLRLAGNDFSGALPSGLYEVQDHDLYQDMLCLRLLLVGEGLLADCETLLAARDALADDVFLDWKRAKPIVAWQGVTIDDTTGEGARVVALDLTGAELNGRIPPVLGELDQLVSLRLADNRLTGPIPSELGQLEHLEELWLRGNRLSGKVPQQLGTLGNLSLLRLAGNDFSGALPPGLYEVQDHDLYQDMLCLRLLLVGEGLLADCETLLAARDALADDVFLDWKRAKPIVAWQGVTIDDTTGEGARVVALDLTGAELNGRIPPVLGELDQLVSLRLADNRLTGPIPSELGQLEHLEELWLRGNRLSGEVPQQLGTLGNLSLLRLAGNDFSGTLPPGLYDVASHDLDRNLHCPAAPRSNTGLVNDCVVLLELRGRLIGDLSGPSAGRIGNEAVGRAAALDWGDAIPVEFWQGVTVAGTPARITALDLPEMGLAGIVPPELSELNRLEVLRLNGNGLTGSIPPELGRLDALVWLDLDKNALTGPIPPELGMLANLRRLALDGNALSGPIPPELEDLSNLEELRLADNRLTGPIPPELGALANLSVMQLGGNKFTGCIPRELRDSADRELELDLLCDPFTGSGRGLREDISALMEMRDILAGSTKLNWSYATPIASWEGVTVSPVRSVDRGAQEGGTARGTERVIGLDMSGMGLDGHLPPALGSLEKLIWLRLNGNRLSGPIPPELGQLTGLLELGLESNALTGPIPRQIGQLASLSELWLGHNRLSGPIPPELAALDRLSVLHMRGNAFTGCLPPLDKVTNQFRARPDGLPECDAPPSAAFLGDVVRRINAAVDPMRFDTIPDSAHNLYLQIGVQMGILGLGALALLCASLIFNLRVRAGAPVTPVHCYAAACTIVVLVCETFDVNLLQSLFTVGCVAWILMGLAAGAVNHDERVAGPPLNA